jgi:mortality factor 4-like protein 1
MVFIGMQLLYRFERAQYASTRKDYLSGPDVKPGEAKEMSAIYGAEHLLRMLGMQASSCSCERLCLFGEIVALPAMLAQTTLEGETAVTVKDFVDELLL